MLWIIIEKRGNTMLSFVDIEKLVKSKLSVGIIEIKNDEFQLDEYIKNKCIMEFDDFVKQIIYELYVNCYKGKCDTNGISVVDFYKNQIIQEPNRKTMFCTNDSAYKSTLRSYKKYRQHNDENIKKIKEKYNIKEQNGDIQLLNLDTADKRGNGHKIRKYQEFQQKIIMKYEIFHYIENGSISSSKRINDSDLIDMLEKIDKIYNEIDEVCDTYFEKSLQYYDLENMCHIEMVYLLARALSLSKKKLSEKKQDKLNFNSLFAISYQKSFYQNKFIIANQKYIEKYEKDEKFDLNSMSNEILQLCMIKKEIIDIIEKKVDCEKLEYDFNDAEIFFENYLGKGQHIIRNKDWTKIKLKDFRDFYISNI